MSLRAAQGFSQGQDGREVGQRAARQALDGIGRTPPLLAWVIADDAFPLSAVLAGVGSVLSDTPVMGFSTTGQLTAQGECQRAVVVLLLAGEGVEVKADLWTGFGEDPKTAIQKMVQALQPAEVEGSALLVALDGISGDAAALCAGLPKGKYTLAGTLAGGSLYSGRTYVAGGRQSGAGSLAAARLNGKIRLGVGAAHGWQAVGAFSLLTRVQGVWVREMDEKRPSEVFSNLFGYPARDWAYPPLNELVRLYPLGLDQDGELQIRSALRMEADGSLRMNSALPEGKSAYLMTGSMDACLAAAQRAAHQALRALGEARPVMALVFADVAWQSLFQARPGSEIQAVSAVLGADIPVGGGYGFGQLLRRLPGNKGTRPFTNQPLFLNAHIEVVVFGEL